MKNQNETGFEKLLAQMERLQVELAELKTRADRLPRPAAPIAPAITATRRKTLKRLGLSLLAGLGAGVAVAASSQPAQARIFANPGGADGRVGSIIVPPGMPTPGGTPQGATTEKYGLVVTDGSDSTFDLTKLSTHGTGLTSFGSYYGVYASSNYFGVYGTGNFNGVVGSGTNNGVYGTGSNGVYGTGSDNGVLGHGSTGVAGTGTGVAGIGVSGNSDSNIGVSGTGGTQGVLGQGSIGVQGNGGFTGVFGTGTNNGVYGTSTGTTGIGVNGQGGATGVSGTGDTYGVKGINFGGALTAGVRGEGNNIGIWGYCTSGSATGGVGVYGSKGSGAYAGYFDGPVFIQGPLAKPGGSFKIDHPLDPANKYLYHSFVESPDMKNIYDGIATLDEQGRTLVELPDWFEALNTDFRYQLTCLEGYAPVFISARISGGKFEIAGGWAGQEICWQVTGIRQDAWAKAHRIPVEEVKDAKDSGKYLHPEVFNKPVELRIDNQS